MPIVQVAIAIRDLAVGAELAVQATDPAFLADIRAWARMTGHELAEVVDGPIKHVVVRKTQ
jgi:TusA-related sulfurtransferase